MVIGTHGTRSRLAALSAGVLLAGLTTGSAELSPPTPAAGSAVRAAPAGPRLIPLPAPRDFRRHVTNRWFPLAPGTRWVYAGHGSEGGQRETVRVLHRTRTILGIRATVVSDRVTEDGVLIEKTFDWYAQDRWGRVWYLGENTTSYDGGSTSKAGSWEAGKDGAEPGIVMFARGRIHRPYWQEYLAGEAEDQGMLLDRRAKVGVPAGRFSRVRVTKDTTPLEPGVMELKFYAPGVGLVLEVGTSPEQGKVTLVRFRVE